jgi:CO/xanthine dehydrogenase FAD-binding subunit
VRPAVVIDLNRVSSLARVEVMDAAGQPPGAPSMPRSGLRLGALVRQQALERDRRIASSAPLLTEAAPLIGHLQTRARGTVGGSLVHADPAAELPACMIALDATFHIESVRGRRTQRAEDFFLGLLATDLAADEVLVEVEVPATPGDRVGHGFAEVARRHGDFALAGACAVVALDADDVCRRARLVVFGAADVPHLARAAAGLVGECLDAARCADVGRATADEIETRGDLHATAHYRRRVAAGLAARALGAAAARAGAA